MKKVFFSLLMLTTVLLVGYSAKAQSLKIGIFDIDAMVMAMPDYTKVDSLVQIYDRDSLGAQYDIYVSEYKRLDSTARADSAAHKPQAVLDYTAKQLNQVRFNLQYWQQIAQQQESVKRNTLAQPLYEKVVASYKKILDAKKYTLILKPTAIEQPIIAADNLFISVAKDMGLTQLPQELLQLGPDPDAQKTSTPSGNKTPSTKPKTP